MRRAVGLAALLAIAVACVSPEPLPSPAPTADPAARQLAEFVRSHAPGPQASSLGYGLLLTDQRGIVVRREDGTELAAVLADIHSGELSPGARHLTYWTSEERGIRELHVFDLTTLAAPHVVVRTDERVEPKMPLVWSADEAFVAFAPPGTRDLVRVVHVASGDALDLAGTATLWTASGLVLRRAGTDTLLLVDPASGATRQVARDDPALAPTPRPSADPGSALAHADRRFTRPDGSAVIYLDFDSSHGGRWYGERVEVATGRHVAMEWSTGGNPAESVFVAPDDGRGTHTYAHVPRDPAGERAALWLARQGFAKVTREAIRTITYGEWLDFDHRVSFSVPRSALVRVIVIQALYSFEPRGGPFGSAAPVTCRSYTFVAPVDRSSPMPSLGGGCNQDVWPRLPPAFDTPGPLDWISPNGPEPLPSPGPSPAAK